MTYGGLCGFEEEDYRQSCLRGRRFTSAEKASADKQFHKTSVFLAGDVKKKYSESSVDRPMSKSLSVATHAVRAEYAGSQGRAAGEITGAASSHGYNVLNGESVFKTATREPRSTYSDPIPVAQTPGKASDVLLPIINNSSLGSSYDERIMSGGLNQYKNAAEALKPIGNYPAVRSCGDTSTLSSSFQAHLNVSISGFFFRNRRQYSSICAIYLCGREYAYDHKYSSRKRLTTPQSVCFTYVLRSTTLIVCVSLRACAIRTSYDSPFLSRLDCDVTHRRRSYLARTKMIWETSTAHIGCTSRKCGNTQDPCWDLRTKQ